MIGLLLLLAAYTFFRRAQKMLKYGHITKAKIIRMIFNADEDSHRTFIPVLSFQDHNSQHHEIKSSISVKQGRYNQGDEVDVVYFTEVDFQAKMMTFWSLYSWPVILACVASPFLVIGISYYLYNIG